ncbi:hypothetical protein [Deinococcus ficus]|uniref:hypothetical protein n=1 Tax=Deinococcus ficus TaxID=317577 RepID=UPI0012DEB59B|nr:hypothetical protein [Deinococcus ficus]
MRKILIACTLLLGTASGLSQQQREQHINQVFSAAGISLINCPSSSTPNITMFCGQTSMSDTLVRQSWDLYSDWSSKVTNTAKHKTAWSLSDTGKAYSATFSLSDGDFYVVTTSSGSAPSFVIVSWLNISQQASTSSSSVTQSSSQASSQTDKPKSKCDPRVTRTASVSGTSWVHGSWLEPAVFPKPSQEFKLGGPSQDYSIVCPTFRADFSNSTGEYTFKGSSFNDIVLYSGVSYYDNVTSIDFYDSSESGDDLRLVGLTYNKRTKKFELSTENPSAFINLPIGYRVNNGTLKPLYFEGKIYPIDLPADAKILEVYASPSKNTGWQYLKIDFSNNSVTLKRSYPFPSN